MTDYETLIALRLEAGGLTRLVTCMRVTIYFDVTPPAEIVEYCDAAFALLRPTLTHYQAGSMKKPAAINSEAGGIVASWFRRPNERQGCFAWFTAGGPEGTASGTLRVVLTYRPPLDMSPTALETRRERMRVLYEERGFKTATAVGEITFTLPIEADAARPDALLAWMLARNLVNATPFASGHAGLGLNHDGLVADTALSARIEGQLAYAVTRHPGLDWQKNPILDQIMRYDAGSRDLLPRIKRVNWLTLVSDRTLTLTGGPDQAARALAAGSGVRVNRLAHGLLLQAGAEPALGDSNAGDMPAAYCYTGHLLRHVRLPVLKGEGRGFPDELAQRWLTAFDDAGPS